ncbi:response regulator transcription factor [bacterium]|nr:response regulator transcription factor [bacterium]
MSISISIIEDHEIFRKALANLLSDREELEVQITASNGRDFLDQMLGKEPTDVILVDFEMPLMDGPETVKQIRKNFGNKVKVLTLSIHKEPRLVNEMLDAGANGFVTKDASSDELFLAIRRVLDIEFYISPLISKQIYTKKDGKKSLFKKDPLSDSELEMLKLICEQKTNKEISDSLNITINTANTYRNRLLQKTGMKNSAGLVVYAIQEGIFRI